MKIPIVDLAREYEYIKQPVERALKTCLVHQRWILGEEVKRLEQKIASYLGTRAAVGVASGTDALLLSLRALSLLTTGREFWKPGDLIITTPFTFIATGEAIIRAGATPLFVDVSPDTYTMNPAAVEALCSSSRGKRVVGIVPVHLYGLSCQMDKILAIAKRHKLFVVEDTAQAFGGRYKGKKLGTFGDAGAFSFFPSKNLGAYGDGGMVATSRSELADIVRILRNHGERKQYRPAYTGYTSRLDTVQAAILLVKMRSLEKFNRMRRSIARTYKKLLVDIPGITLPREPKDTYHVYHLYTIRCATRSMRDTVLQHLNARGITARVYYPYPLHRMDIFRQYKTAGKLSTAEHLAKQVVSLPIHPFMKDREIAYVARCVREAIGA